MLLEHTCVCAVEIEPYCRKVLLQRQRDGMLPKFPIWDDVRTFDGKPWRGKVDVVCGGFAMPIRDGWARNVFIITSGENMAIHAAANIATAVETFAERGYARLGGIILNARDVPREAEKVEELACDLNTTIVGRLPRSAEVQEADALGLTVLEHAPSSGMADRYRELARRLVEACAATRPEPARGGFTF